MTVDTIRIGVVGSGYMGLTYCEAITKWTTGCQLVAITGGKRAEYLAQQYEVRVFPEVDEIFDSRDVDAVILATPDFNRPELTTKAAAAGVHVLAEKPMAPTVETCDEMIAVCEAAHVNLAVVKTERERDISRCVEEIIHTGEIGRLQMMRTISSFPYATTVELFRDRPWMFDGRSGGFFLSMACHNVDYMRWITGQEATGVSSFGHLYGQLTGLPLSVMAQIQLTEDIMAQMLISAELPEPGIPQSDFRFEIVGDKGIVDVDSYGRLRLGKRGSWKTVFETPAFDYLSDPKSPERLIPHVRVVQEFVNSIREQRPPRVGGQDGRAAVEICAACLLSVSTGRTVPVGQH